MITKIAKLIENKKAILVDLDGTLMNSEPIHAKALALALLEINIKMTPEELKKAITKKTAMLLLNSPNNPGGFSYTPQELAALAKVLEGTNIMVLSDEIYEKLIYGDTRFVSFASLSEDAYNRTLTLNGFSKAFSMTGWRLGYTAGPLEVIKAMGRLQSHMTSNPVTFGQYAAIAAFNDEDGVVEKMRTEFEKRGEYMAQRTGISGRFPVLSFQVLSIRMYSLKVSTKRLK